MKHSENLIKAALDLALGVQNYGVNGQLTVEENTKVTTRAKQIKSNFVDSFEKTLLTNLTHQLRYDRHNDDVIFFSSTPGREEHLEAARAQYWYRTMKKSEYLLHKKDGEFVELPDFAGVAPNHKYSRGYLTNNSDEIMTLEWDIPGAGKLYQMMTANGITVKAEGGGTYGLGTAGTQDHRAGVDHIKSHAIFNSISGRFKVVDLRAPNRLDAC